MNVAKKYYWTRKEEAKLLEFYNSGLADPEALAEKFEGRTPGSIRKKLERLGVVVVKKPQRSRTTTSVPLGEGLLTHEQALRILIGAIEMAQQSGLDKLEIMRLRVLVDAAKTYDSLLEKFEKWVEIENRLLEMEREIAELEKAQKVQS